MLSMNLFGGHTYTLAATGIKIRDRVYPSRQLANEEMYHLIKKKGLHIIEVYDDKHYKTFICNNGVRFYVNRV